MTVQVARSEVLEATHAERAEGSLSLALRYTALAFGALLLAPFAHGLAWLLAWIAISNLAVAYAYATNRVSLFGKRADGSMAPIRTLLLLPYLALVWSFFWLKLAGLRREACWHEAAPGLYIGRRPRSFELPADCSLVIDLTSEFMEPRAVVSKYHYRCLPVLNRHVPSSAELELLLLDLVDFEGGLYVHCGAGRGRSAMLIAALLVLRGHAADVDHAERQLKALRPGVHLHSAQKALIARLCGALLLRRAAAPQMPASSATTLCA